MDYEKRYFEEKFSTLQQSLQSVQKEFEEVKASIKSIEKGYISAEALELYMGPLQERVKKLEGRNVWFDRVVGAILISALLGVIVTRGGI